MTPSLSGHSWAVILAAGDGCRLLPLTRALYGESLPKQFATLHGERSLLQETADRIADLVPAERTVVVVASRYQALARSQLSRARGIEVVAQPRNLGTGPGLLLPLARIRARDPEARIAVFPSDHHFRDPRPLVAGMRTALAEIDTTVFPLALIGVEARRAETEYGWIEAARQEPGCSFARVERFVEKPSADLAALLLQKRALWNTLIFVARLADLWTLLWSHLPAQASAFELYSRFVNDPGAGRLLDVLYEEMEPANLSRDVLGRAATLGVLPVSGAGFSDWGTPERVLESLAGTRAHEWLLERLAHPPAYARV